MTASGSNVHVLVLATAEWDRPLWTNKQYIARELAAEFRVTYVNSVGQRQPTLSISDARRIVARLLRRLREVVSRSAETTMGPTIVTPLVLPSSWRSPLATRFNQRQVRRVARDWIHSPGVRLLWTFSPETFSLLGEADAAVYHCVDLQSEFPGFDRDRWLAAERELAAGGSVPALASSEGVRAHLERIGFGDVMLMENVADVERFRPPKAGAASGPRRVVFAGNLTEAKVDFDALEAVASDPRIELHVAGSIAEGGGSRGRAARLVASETVAYHGVLSVPEMAELFATCDIGIIPYEINPYTAGVFPLKLWEYLAAGLTVVCSELPSVIESERVMAVGGDVVFYDQSNLEELVDSLGSHPAATEEDLARRSRAARTNGWAARGREVRQLVRDGRLSLS